MSGLKRLIPDDVRNRLNESPIFQLAVIALIAAVGTFLIWNGLKGIRTRSITSKGREYTGGTAIAVGVLQCLAGGMAIAGAIFAILVRCARASELRRGSFLRGLLFRPEPAHILSACLLLGVFLDPRPSSCSRTSPATPGARSYTVPRKIVRGRRDFPPEPS